ncbi:TPA: hypothetical protein N8030_002950 [Escherichia coli]|uniref:AP2 domain protein n=1 Tax=Escherichia marmotae TaxID=1499973 RepID=A0A370VA21_9ESCH|nr:MULTISPECIES: hypothetical protein [Escherichia]EFN4050376.1 hypothetical protein [Escherichia coli]EHB5924747.1 hypothetical protein [Escherichia coli]EHU9037545.1 hypothetical protein [Escherichia coli]EHU9092867.1 hypothetical protein [Escherichia coli]EHU9097687.1 hypothetical protein [Escherichia coli]
MKKVNDLKGKNKNLPLAKKALKRWNTIHNRVASNKNYTNVTICDEWYTFSKFYEWFKENYVEDWDIDKDICGSKEYSPKTSIFVPHFINLMFRDVNNIHGKGVSITRNGKYQAQAKWNGIPQKFGTFNSCQEATAAYEAERKQYLYQLSVDYGSYTELSNLLRKHSR